MPRRVWPCLVLGDHRTREEFQKPWYTRSSSCMTNTQTRLLCITAEAKAEPIPHTRNPINSLGHLGNSSRGRANSAPAYTAHAAQRARASPASCFTWMSRQPLPPLPATTTSPATRHPPSAPTRAHMPTRGTLPRTSPACGLSQPPGLAPPPYHPARGGSRCCEGSAAAAVGCLVVRVEGELLLEAVVLLGQVEAVLLPRTGKVKVRVRVRGQG